MKAKILAICDVDEIYARKMQEYFQSRNIPYQIQIFTQVEEFLYFLKENTIEICVVAQSFYKMDMELLNVKNLYILKEETEVLPIETLHINKYQSAESILKQIIIHYSEKNQTFFTKKGNKGHIIGMYTPVKRCLQTSFSILLGQALSKKSKVLYLNLEGYSGFQALIGKTFQNDLSDLLYNMKHAEDKLMIRLHHMTENIGGMDFIPPALSVRDLEEVEGEEIKQLLQKIAEEAHYDFIILDLSDFLRGIFSILNECEKIYTITPRDGIGMAKIEQYEKTLQQCGYEGVLEKTHKCNMPQFKYLPYQIEELLHSELNEYIKDVIKEDFSEFL